MLEIRYHPGKSSIKDRILAAQKEAVMICMVGRKKGDVRTMIMYEAHKSKYFVHLVANKMYMTLEIGIDGLAEVGEGQLIGLELVQESTDKISQIKDRLKAVPDHQKSYADKRRKPLESSVVPLDEIQVNAKLNFMKEPVEILEREFKKLKRSEDLPTRQVFGGNSKRVQISLWNVEGIK
ncbi:hypothetical protein Tco_1408560 [Tanacetum coccineum]